MNVTNGLMYVRHLLHLAMIVSETTGTGFSSSRRVIYGRIVNANGILVFLRRLLLCGIHPSVERIYSGGQFESSEGVRDVFKISSDKDEGLHPMRKKQWWRMLVKGSNIRRCTHQVD